MHPDTALSLFTGTLVSHNKVYTSVRIRSKSHLFLGEFVGIPFIYVTRRSIARPATECCTARLPGCQTARLLHDLFGQSPTRSQPRTPGSSALLLRPTPTASTRTKPLVGLAWPAARSRHTFAPRSVRPGGPPPPPACAAGRSGIDSFARPPLGGQKSQPTRSLTHYHCR